VKARLRQTLLAVADLPRALRFYRAAFDWTPVVERKGYAELGLAGGARLALTERAEVTPAPGDKAGGAELILDVDDVQAATHRLVAAGARVIGSIGGTGTPDERATVADPWGNQLVLTRRQPGTDDVERLRALTLRWLKLWQGGDAADFYQLHDMAFVDHSPAGRAPNLEGYRQGLRQLYDVLPDFDLVVEDLVVDAASRKVAVLWSATGTHKGDVLGIPATGKSLVFRGIEVVRIERDRIVERWGEWDSLAILKQLGAAPALRSS
jgi:steroid delta-isomerase-like uncharacterized protein